MLLAAGGGLQARFTVALPAEGRTVLGRWAAAILIQNLPRCSFEGALHCLQRFTMDLNTDCAYGYFEFLQMTHLKQDCLNAMFIACCAATSAVAHLQLQP